jgi:excisionase family DNA binding protein
VSSRLLTAREVAEQLGFSVDTVLRWTREGRLRGYRISGTKHGRLRYREDELEALLAERATGATDRGSVSHHDGRAHGEGYVPLESSVSVTTPPLAATIEEEHTDATR